MTEADERPAALSRMRFLYDKKAKRTAKKCEYQLIELRRMDSVNVSQWRWNTIRVREDHTPGKIRFLSGAAAGEKAPYAGDWERGGAGDCYGIQYFQEAGTGDNCSKEKYNQSASDPALRAEAACAEWIPWSGLIVRIGFDCNVP